jgi:hypothetical protein
MEILLIGFPEGIKNQLKIPPDFRLEWLTFSDHFTRRFYDYDVLVLNPTYDVSLFFDGKREELRELLNGGGLIISFSQFFCEGWFNCIFPMPAVEELDFISKKVSLGKADAIKSLTSPIRSIKAGAKTINITPKAGILSRVLKEMDWYEYYFPELPSNSIVIANDKVGHPIAFRTPCLSGEIILLPGKSSIGYSGSDAEKYWLRVLSALLEILPKLKKIPEKIELPAWITSYQFPEEEELIRQKREIERKLEKIQFRKYLIVARGRPLQDAVELALKDIGFTVEKLPEGAYADFILKLGDKEIGAVEVTSSVGSIEVKEFRQLLHFLKDCEIDKKEMKGILIGNHYCEKILKERGEAFTADAINAAEKHGVALITTADLFKVLSLLDQGKILQKDIQTKMLGVGVCKLI